MRVGTTVYCTICPRPKAPHGRSVSIASANGFCSDECRGYNLNPAPGCLFDGETEKDFGYPICSNATKEVSA